MWSHVPCDILEEIMKTLPVKSLIRLRSVCKAWKSLIDSSEFIAAYSNLHADNAFPQRKFSPTVPRLFKNLDPRLLTIIGSSHGLLCYCYREKPQEDVVLFWNPSIRKSIGVVIRGVVKEPFANVFGFGVCPRTGDPKLVKVTHYSAWTKTEVFSLSSKEWTRIPCNNLPRKSIAFTQSHTNIGQFIYWVASDRIAKDGGFWNRNLIMSFDMSTKEFREIDLPDSLAPLLYVDLSVSRLRGSLALLQSTDDITGTGRGISVWMMEDGDPKSFKKLYTIKPSLDHATLHRTLGFTKSGEPIIDMILDGYCSKLGILANRSSCSVNSYMESLLLLNEEDDSVYRI